MQRFSQGASLLLAQVGAVAPAGSVDIERLIDEWIQVQSRQAQGNWLLWFVVMQLLAIISYWIASNVVTRDRTAFTNATRLWVLMLVGGLSIGFLGGLASAIGIALNAPIIVALALCASAVFVLIILVTLPMRVYGISFIRAVAFVGITFILLVAGQLAFAPLLPLPALDPQHEAVLHKLANLSDAQREQFFRGLWQRTTRGQLNPTASAEAIAADRSKSIEQRHAALKGMFDDLEKRRAALTWGDAGALVDYNRRNARYQELLAELQKDALEAGK